MFNKKLEEKPYKIIKLTCPPPLPPVTYLMLLFYDNAAQVAVAYGDYFNELKLHG